MRNGFRTRRHAYRHLRYLESLEPRTLLSASTLIDSQRGLYVQAVGTTVDNEARIQTYFAIAVGRGIDTPQGSAPVVSYSITLLLSLVDSVTQDAVAGFNMDSFNTPPMTLTISRAGDVAHFSTILQLANEDTGQPDTLAIDLTWNLGQTTPQNTDTQLNVTAGSVQFSSSRQDGGVADVSGTLDWTQLEPALQDRIAPHATVAPAASSGIFSRSAGQTIALPPNANLAPFIQLVTPPSHPPRGARITFIGERTAQAMSADTTKFIQVTDGFQAVPPIPVTPPPAFYLDLNNSFDLIMESITSGASVSLDGHAADLSSSAVVTLTSADGTRQPATLDLNLHWQWTGAAPTCLFDCYTFYGADSTVTAYGQSVTYPAALSGGITSDNPAFNPPVFDSRYNFIQIASTVTITAPTNRVQAPLMPTPAPVPEQDWQTIILPPWRQTLRILPTLNLRVPASLSKLILPRRRFHAPAVPGAARRDRLDVSALRDVRIIPTP